MVKIYNISKVIIYLVADAISRLPLNGNQETSQRSTYQQEIVSEINYIEEIPEGNFPINLILIQQPKREEPNLMAKYKNGVYHEGSFRGGGNDKFSLITCKDNIIIPSKI